jgi:serine/threonine protein kinase
VANSLEYLHGISLLHGDVKLDNVLLKTDPLRPLGFVPKVRPPALPRLSPEEPTGRRTGARPRGPHRRRGARPFHVALAPPKTPLTSRRASYPSSHP